MLVRYINLDKKYKRKGNLGEVLVYDLNNGNRDKIDRALKKGLYSKIFNGEKGKDDTGKGASLKIDKNIGTKKELYYPYGSQELKDFLNKNSRLYFRENMYSKPDNSLSFDEAGVVDLFISPHILRKLRKDKNLAIPFNEVLVSLTLDDCF